MGSWHKTAYMHKLGMNWHNNPEISEEDKTHLKFIVQLNYFGYFAEKLLHCGGLACLYYKSWFDVPKTNMMFYLRFFGTLGFAVASSYRVDVLLREQVWMETEHLRLKHGSKIDDLRRNYQQNKGDMQMHKEAELRKLYEAGFNVRNLLFNDKDTRSG
jgi:hypothetical protein